MGDKSLKLMPFLTCAFHILVLSTTVIYVLFNIFTYFLMDLPKVAQGILLAANFIILRD
jgi:hypothetical protein